MEINENLEVVKEEIMSNIKSRLELMTSMMNGSSKVISNNASSYSYNRLIYGAPGTGKSYLLEDDRKLFVGENYERVTFYEDYSYGQFVGSYKPTTDRVGNISYKFVPGPFIRLLVNAMNNPQDNYVLIIEEINRAKAASVFGDMFQLIDRDGNTGEGEYGVAISEDLKLFLIGNVKEYYPPKISPKYIKLPSNLYIWATMNTADQGVYPLDSAFKRRFDEYKLVGINENESQKGLDKINVNIKCNSIGIVNWNLFRKELNKLLLTVRGIKEDKLIGPFFIKPDILQNDSKFQQVFKDKLLMYLLEDVLKNKNDKLFDKDCSSLSAIIDKYGNSDGKGIVFDNVFADLIIKNASVITEKKIDENSEDENNDNSLNTIATSNDSEITTQLGDQKNQDDK